jgi:anti-sigma B factor antagonist
MVGVDADDGARGSVEGARDASGAPVVEFIGEIDISNAEVLGARLDRLIDGEENLLVVDLTKLEFMDSSGIAMLLRAAARAGTIEVRNPSDVVRRIIECTGLADVLNFET